MRPPSCSCRGRTSFYILRFLLGVAEAGFFPGVILFLTYWIPARHLSRARGYFYMGIALAGILGNPLSGGLLELNGLFGLRGIQWMFLIEGLLAVVVGVWSFFYLTDNPKDAKWLPDDERLALAETIAAEDTAKAEGHGPQKVLGGARKLAGLVLRADLLLHPDRGLRRDVLPAHPGDGHHRAEARLPGLAGDRHPVGVRAGRGRILPGLWRTAPASTGRSARALLLVTAFGIVISGALSGTPVLAIAGLSLAAMGFVAMQPIFWTLPTEYMTGFAAAAGIGLINSLGNLGGFLAPNMRDYFKETLGGNAGLYSSGRGRGRRCDPVRPDRVLQEGQRDRGRPPGRGGRRRRCVALTLAARRPTTRRSRERRSGHAGTRWRDRTGSLPAAGPQPGSGL